MMKMTGRWMVGTCFMLCTTGVLAEPLRFHVPEGWTDLGPQAAKEALAKAPPAIVQAARGSNFLAYAMDLDHGDDGFTENFNVVPTAALPGPVTEKTLDEVLTAMGGEIQKAYPGAVYKVQEKGLRVIHGVTCGRWVADATLGGVAMKQVVYFMSGETQGAVLTYSTTPKEYPTYQPIFDDAASKTLGLKEPPSATSKILSGAGAGAVRGAIIGGLVALIVGVFKARAKKKAA